MSINQVQAPLGNRLFAPSQPLNVYSNGVLMSPTLYTVDYPNGIISFIPALADGTVVTADFTTNQSIPADVARAVMFLVGFMVGQDLQNALGANSYGIQTYNVNFGADENKIEQKVEKILSKYIDNTPKFL